MWGKMANQILLKRTATPGKAPQTADIELGELAVNTTDGKLFFKKSASGTETIVEIGAVAESAGTADKLATARTIALSGDVTGSTTFDGSVNRTITVTLAASGVTPGTYNSVVVDAKGRVTSASNSPFLTEESDTLATVTGRGATTGTAVSITNNTASTSSSTGALKVTGGVGIGGNLNVGGNLSVTGNLTINGTTTTVNSTTVTVDDPIITLGGDAAPTSDDNKDRGIEFRWHNGTAAKIGFFGFDDSTGRFVFIPDATNTNEVFAGTKGTIEADLIGNVTGDVSGNAGTATKLATACTIALSGDATGSVSFDGSANRTITVTLAASGVSAGTYNRVTVDAKGRVTAASNVAYLTGNQNITVSGDASGSGTTAITLTLANSGVVAGTYSNIVVDAKGRVTSAMALSSSHVTAALGYTPLSPTDVIDGGTF